MSATPASGAGEPPESPGANPHPAGGRTPSDDPARLRRSEGSVHRAAPGPGGPPLPALFATADLLRSLGIAAAVVSLLVAINLGPTVLLQPWSEPAAAGRYALDFVTPFLVASLGALLANRRFRRASTLPWTE